MVNRIYDGESNRLDSPLVVKLIIYQPDNLVSVIWLIRSGISHAIQCASLDSPSFVMYSDIKATDARL